MTLRRFLKEDLRVLLLVGTTPTFLQLIYAYVRSHKFRVVVRMRLSQWFYKKGKIWRVASSYFYHKNLKCGVDIDPSASIGAGLRLAHPVAVVIGEGVEIGSNVRIQQCVTLGGNSGKERIINNRRVTMPSIANYCFIGPGACVLGPIVLGEGAVVGANSVVQMDVEEWSVVSGAPTKVVKRLGPDDIGRIHYKEMVSVSRFHNDV